MWVRFTLVVTMLLAALLTVGVILIRSSASNRGQAAGKAVCPSCGTGNPDHAKFCAQCGTPLGQ